MKTKLLLASLALLPVLALAPAGAQSADDAYEHEILLHEFEGGGYHIAPERIVAKAGDTLRFTVKNPEVNKVSHDLVVCQEPPHADATCGNKLAFTPMIPPGESREITFTVPQSGTFEYFCTVLGHKSGTPGMKGELVVQGSAVDAKESPGVAVAGALAALAGVALALRRR